MSKSLEAADQVFQVAAESQASRPRVQSQAPRPLRCQPVAAVATEQLLCDIHNLVENPEAPRNSRQSCEQSGLARSIVHLGTNLQLFLDDCGP